MKKTANKISVLGLVGTMVLTSASNVMAGTKVNSSNVTNIKDTYANTIMLENKSTINANGKDVIIEDLDTVNIENSLIDTLVSDGQKSINANGEKIGIISFGEFDVENSAIDIMLNTDSKDITAEGSDDVDVTNGHVFNASGSMFGTLINQTGENITTKMIPSFRGK